MRRVDGLELSPAEVILAARLVSAGVAATERRNGCASPAALQLRDQLAAFAREYLRETASVQVDGDRETAKLPAVVIVAGSARTQTVGAAAGLLGISPQHVRGLCRDGELIAVKTVTGWRIEGWSVADLAAARQKGSLTAWRTGSANAPAAAAASPPPVPTRSSLTGRAASSGAPPVPPERPRAARRHQ